MLQRKNTQSAQLRLVAKESRPCYGKIAKRPTRRLLLVDIENYCGKGVLGPEDVREAKETIDRELGLRDDDLVVIGTSHGMNCLVCGSEWEGPRQVLHHGHNGADLALIDASREYRLDTFSSLIIVSGDGIFADVALAFRAEKRHVIVVHGRGGLSRQLRHSATGVMHIRPHARPAA